MTNNLVASTTSFTKSDDDRGVRQTTRLLCRFILSLPILRAALLPSILLSFIAVTLPQIYLWLVGQYANCSAFPCQVELTNGRYIQLDIAVLLYIASAALTIRILSWATFECCGRLAGSTLHKQMVSGLMRVRTTYFDETPSGRVINRLINDFDRLRIRGTLRINATIQTFLELAAIGVTIGLADARLGLAMIPCALVLLWWQSQLVPMLQRLSLIKASRFGEVLHRESDLIDGGRILSIYSAQRAQLIRVKAALKSFIDAHMLRGKIEAAGQLRFALLEALYATVVVLTVATAVAYNSLTEILGAVIVATVLRLGPSLRAAIEASTNLLDSAADVRRVFEVIDLKAEEDEELGSIRRPSPPIHRSQTSRLTFDNYSMRYRPHLPLIFNRLSLEIPLHKRVGIVGRSGSGKSSLVQSLYRMVHVVEGEISLNGVSFHSEPITVTRRRFALVPQDPYLFAGTVRQNIDRCQSLSDADVIRALRLVGVSLALDYKLEEGGRNLSFGQRQLLCLARVVALKPEILILDEPTSGIDSVTDAQIQSVLEQEFRGRTVITIAHRLETLRGYDYIIEFADGQVIRKGTPSELGINPAS
jgi:ATP-binding cassette subfamily C (CFTR/MRP) protein 1